MIASLVTTSPHDSSPVALGGATNLPASDVVPAARPTSTLALLVGGLAFASVAVIDPGGWFPFSVAKWWAVLVAALAGLAYVTASTGRFVAYRSGRGASIAMVGLATLVTASAVTGVDGLYAWTGTPVRHLGALTWWLFTALFVAGTTLGWRSRRTSSPTEEASERVEDADPHDEIHQVAGALTLAGLVLAGYCVWEAAVGRPVDFSSSSDRLAGPFGSSAYLGACCCLLLPAAIGLAWSQRSGVLARCVAAVSALGMLFAVVGSGSRAAMVGLGVAGVLTGYAATRARDATPSTGRSASARRPVLAAAALGLLTAGGAAWFAAARGVFERDAGWSTRLAEWSLALRVIAERPLLGHGPEGYRIAAFSAVDDDYARRFGDGTIVDRAHSGILDVAATSGLFAALLYAVVLAYVVRSAIIVIRTGRCAERGVGAAVVAYAVGQQLLFPIAEIDPIFWLLAGFVVARASNERVADDVEPLTGAHASRLPAVVSILVIGLTVGAAVFAVRAMAADRIAADAMEADNSIAAVASSQRAENLAPLDIRHGLHTAQLSSMLGTLKGVDGAIEAAERAAEISPADPPVRIELARLYSLRASVTGHDNDRERAEIAWSNLVSDAPSCARCHLGAALAAGERGDFDVADSELHRAAELGNAAAIERLR